MREITSEFTSSDPVALANTAQQVSFLYGFLSSIYRAELTLAHLQALLEPEMVEMLSRVGVDLQGAFWNRPDAELLDALAVEYTLLFLGPGGHVSPHESVQIEEGGGNYWGNETAAVRRFITETGIEYDPEYKGIPDHISVELEFLGELARRESLAWKQVDMAAVGNCLAYQQDFLEEHLGRWVEKFCGRVVEIAELSFYRDIARITMEFVRSEIAAVQERLKLTDELADDAQVAQIRVSEAELTHVGVG